jgi:hypothetical protein
MNLENDWLLRKDTLPLRDALCEFFEERHEKIRFLEEKNIGKVRADMIAVLADGLCGIEIKSHSDSYTRLAEQVKGYNKFCDSCYLCVGSIHTHADEHIPPEWGLISISVREGAGFRILREPQDSRRDVLKNQLALLWRTELSAILQAEGLPRYAGKSKSFICDALMKKIPHERLRAHLCDALFERDYTLLPGQTS